MIWWRKKQSQDRERSNAPKVVSLPEHITHVYAIGDVHGMKDLATKAEAAIAVDPSFSSDTSLILYLGDLVDRGPDTAFLLDWITVPSKIGANVSAW